MAKKKETKPIRVKNPKNGVLYEFEWLGERMIGTLLKQSKKLTEHYGIPWYTMVVHAKYAKDVAPEKRRDMFYPVSIYGIVRKHVD